MKLKGKKIAFLGDSITEGIGASRAENNFVEIIKREGRLKAAYNYGISGTRIAKQNKPSDNPEWDRDFISRVCDMEKDVDAVIVFGGTNDFGHGDIKFGRYGDTTEETFCGSCYILMKKLIEKYSNVPVVFVTPLHRADENTAAHMSGAEKPPLKAYVGAIRIAAEMFSLPVLDLYAEGGMQPMVKAQNELYFADGVHPNDKGYERIARLMMRFFENITD